MKKLVVILALALTACNHTNRYRIQSNGENYFTNDYKKSGDCIVFKSECGCSSDENTITVCGAYSIKEFSDYKPKEK